MNFELARLVHLERTRLPNKMSIQRKKHLQTKCLSLVLSLDSKFAILGPFRSKSYLITLMFSSHPTSTLPIGVRVTNYLFYHSSRAKNRVIFIADGQCSIWGHGGSSSGSASDCLGREGHSSNLGVGLSSPVLTFPQKQIRCLKDTHMDILTGLIIKKLTPNSPV